jgi:hypothetical protein
VQKRQSRQAGLRRAYLGILIALVLQFALGISVNLYVTLPTAGHPGHSSWFGNGPLLALHAALGMFLTLAALFVLIRAIMARNATLIVTSAAGLVAIGLAFFFGASFTEKLTDGYSLGMAISFARWPATPSACTRPPRPAAGAHDRTESRWRVRDGSPNAASRPAEGGLAGSPHALDLTNYGESPMNVTWQPPARSAPSRNWQAVPGERERIAFHLHQFEHGCYGRHCRESFRLYAAWQAALAQSR